MVPYLLLLSCALLPGLGARNRGVGLPFALVGAVYALFVGLRWEVGPDWFGYEILRVATSGRTYGEILAQPEPGFFLLMKLSDDLGWGIVGINAAAAAVFCFGVFALAARTAAPWIALCAATSYLVLALGMSGIRQAMAAGIVFFALSRFRTAPLLGYLAAVGVATLFHASAVAMAPLAAFHGRTTPLMKLACGAVAAAALAAVVAGPAAPLELYAQRYAGGRGPQATGAIFQVLLNAVPAAAYLLYRRTFRRLYGPSPLLTALALAALAMLPAVAVSTVGASRLSMYLTAGAMMIWAGLPRAVGGTRGEADLRVAALLTNAGVMVAWLSFANVAFAYFPYRNVLLGP